MGDNPVYKDLLIGVVAMQGSFAKHAHSMGKMGIPCLAVRRADDLKRVDGMILPGGESTTMTTLLENEELWDPLDEALKTMPVFGTCAGAILLGQQVEDDRVKCFNKIDYRAKRNAYGRQIESFTTSLVIPKLHYHDFHAVFIRAPKLKEIGSGVESLAAYGADQVLVQQDHVLAASFHPELTENSIIHQYFVDEIVLKYR